MRILLDTHILLWFNTEDKRLSDNAWDILLNPNNILYYSTINIWETQIKYIKLPNQFNISGEMLNNFCIKANLNCIHVKPEHAFALKTLKYSEEAPIPHKDPFDRMLICQAKTENMMFMTHDSLLPYYNELCILSV